ncbi:MAG TPA: response regulator [Anaerolineae bacterium]|nr:response regulator [Anaerolineae bacterium]
MKLRIPVSIKITAPLILIIVLSIGLSGYRIYQASTQRWQMEMDRRLEHVAALTAAEVDLPTLQQVHHPIDVNGDAYAAVAETLARAVAMGNIEWIGIYYAKDGYFYYWVDSDYSGVGYPFFYPTDAHRATLADGQTRPVRYTDEFGAYYGFVAPLVAPTEDGEAIIGILEASLSAEASQLLEQRTLSQVAPILGGGILLAIAAATLLMIVVFYHPVQQLHKGAAELLQGHFGYTIPQISNDEIGDLARAFNQMSIKISQLYGKLQAYNHELEERVKERTAEVREERNRLNTILLNIAEGLVVTQLDGRIALANPAFAQIVAQPGEQLRGQALHTVLPIPELMALVAEALTMPEQIFTLNILWKIPGDGKARVYKVVACALVEREALATVLGAVAILHDITHEAEVDQMKTDFISTVSHELRTPLTSVLGFGKLILKTFERNIAPLIPEDDRRAQQATQRIRDNLDIIVTEAERLTRLINDVLDIAKIEAGKVEWHMDNAHLADVIQNAIAATSALAQSKGLSVETISAPSLPQVYIDRDRMTQVVTNLLSNAIKFTDAGSIQVSAQSFTLQADGVGTPELPFGAHLHDLAEGPWIAVSVQDTGIGIAQEDLEKVFEKFKQVGDLMTNRPKGTGLGLTISKEIVEHHGGRIWAESSLGQGSTFTFVLPARNQQPTLAPLVEEIRAHTEVTGELAPQGLRILVVDDESNIRELLDQELTEAGYTVLQAADGVAGLNAARVARPNLIIMDLMMPGISGFDAISALRSDEKTADIPVMILSVLEDREKGYRLGADAYLTKPINIGEVLATVERLLMRAARGEGRKKVLVIEEDASAVDTITKVFHEKGYDVVSATDTTEGVSKALAEQPRFIILNALLSRMNDYEILRTLKCTRETQSASIVVVTMHDAIEDLEEVLEKGADYCGGPDGLEQWVETLSKEVEKDSQGL